MISAVSASVGLVVVVDVSCSGTVIVLLGVIAESVSDSCGDVAVT